MTLPLRPALLAALAVLLAAPAALAQPVRVADIRPGPDGSSLGFITAVDDALYFSADDGTTGQEFWRTTTAGGLERVADINPGTSNSAPGGFTVLGDALYFWAIDGTAGNELWRTTTAGGVERVADINPGTGHSYPQELTAIGDALYFRADDGTSGHELWRFTTAGGAERVADIKPGASGSSPQRLVALGDVLYFLADDGTTGFELWRTTTAGGVERVADINPGAGNSSPQELTAVGDALYFAANDGTTGTELWRTTTAGGVERVADIIPGAGASNPGYLTAVGDVLYFRASDGTTGFELWRFTTAGGAERAADINPGSASSSPQNLMAVGNALYFPANDGTTGFELWRYTTAGGAERVADIKPGAGGSSPQYLTAIGDALYFTAEDGTNGFELWRTTTAGGAERVTDINPGAGHASPYSPTAVGNALYFAANDGTSGHELWRLDLAAPAQPWSVALAAGDHAAGAVGGTHRDGGNVAGMADGATDGLDDGLDAPEPGAPAGDHVQLFVQGPGTDPVFGDHYMRQYVAAQDLGEAVYDVTLVVSAVGYTGQEVAVEAEDVSGVPAGYDVVIVDDSGATPVYHDLRGGPYAFVYAGPRTLTLRVGALAAPSLPAGADPAGLPPAGSTLALGTGAPFTWDSGLEGASDVEAQLSTDGGDTWATVQAGLGPETGAFVLTPDYATFGPDGLDLLGVEVWVRTVAFNVVGDELELGRTSVTFDFGAPAAGIGTAGGGFDADLTVGTEAVVPFALANAAGVELFYSTDGGATYNSVVGPIGNPVADQSQPWDGSATWTPGAGDLSYGGLLQIVATHRDETQTSEAVSDPITVVPASAEFSLAAGFQMSSLPMDAGAQSPAAVYVDGTSGSTVSPLFVYTYAPGSFYTLLDNAAATFTTGQGFWLGAAAAASGSAPGTFVLDTQSLALGAAGSHMVGVPFALPVAIDDLSVVLGPDTKSYAEAVTAGWIAAGLYGWDPASRAAGAYVDATASGALSPWSAYWLPALVPGLTVEVAPPLPTVVQERTDEPLAPEWALTLAVEHADGGGDYTTAFGLHPDAQVAYDAFDQPEPPAPPMAGAVRAYAPRAEWGGVFREYDREVQPPFEAGEAREWPLVVHAPAGPVTVTWSVAPGDLADGLSFEVVDAAASAQQPLVNGGTYTFDSDGSARSLVVVARSAGATNREAAVSPFVMRGASPNPFASATSILLDVPEAVAVTVTVYDAVGREVLRTEQALAAGAGQRVPLVLSRQRSSGVYFYRVTATGAASTYSGAGQMSLIR